MPVILSVVVMSQNLGSAEVGGLTRGHEALKVDIGRRSEVPWARTLFHPVDGGANLRTSQCENGKKIHSTAL
jgi:hypothetical protein